MYREQYKRFYENSTRNHPDWSDGHHHNHAMRLTIKLFLAHLWEFARKLYNLPTRQPYAVEKLGHTNIITAPEEEKKGEMVQSLKAGAGKAPRSKQKPHTQPQATT